MTSIYDFIETEEQHEARRSVLDWWKGDCGWGMDLRHKAITAPSAPKPEELPVTPPPASKAPRYGHSTLHKCLVDGCSTLIGSHQLRCKPHSKARHYEQKKVDRQKISEERAIVRESASSALLDAFRILLGKV